MLLGGGPLERGGERRGNASLTHRPSVSVTLQLLQGGATQLTRYVIEMEISVYVY